MLKKWQVTKYKSQLIGVTHAQKCCTRNLCEKSDASSCKFLVAQQTWLTINTIDDASQKRSLLIKPHNFGHMHACLFCRMEMHSV